MIVAKGMVRSRTPSCTRGGGFLSIAFKASKLRNLRQRDLERAYKLTECDAIRDIRHLASSISWSSTPLQIEGVLLDVVVQWLEPATEGLDCTAERRGSYPRYCSILSEG